MARHHRILCFRAHPGPLTTGIEERSMRHQRKHSHDLRGKPRQIDLFTPVGPGGATATPGWIDLPAETRAALTRLMVRLILEHTDKGRARFSKETGHER